MLFNKYKEEEILKALSKVIYLYLTKYICKRNPGVNFPHRIVQYLKIFIKAKPLTIFTKLSILDDCGDLGYAFNPLSASPTKWSNKLKQFANDLFECV